MNNSKYWDLFYNKEIAFYDIKLHRYVKKGYLHFDNRIWFPEYANSFKKIIFDSNKIIDHSFYPFLRVLIKTKRIRFDKEKGRRVKNIKEREISYAAHFDSLIYSFYSTIIENLYEKYLLSSNINESVLAYRPLNKSNIEFAYEIFDSIKIFEKDNGDTGVIALDIKSFFNSLDHEHLKNSWLKILKIEDPSFIKLPKDHYRVFKSVTDFAYVKMHDLLTVLNTNSKKIQKVRVQRYCEPEIFRTVIRKSKIIRSNNESFGIPQGSPISAVLSNIYMIDYDEAICKLKSKYNFIYKRYCDDILLICKYEDLLKLKNELYSLMEVYKLKIQPEKEDVVIFKKDGDFLKSIGENSKSKKLQYLGFEFDGKEIYIRSSSMSKYHRKMKSGVRETIKRAYGRRSQGNKIFTKKMYEKYTHLGGMNFISYALRSAQIMQSKTIRKQISRHFNQLKSTIEDKKRKHELKLIRKGRFIKQMK